MKRAIGPNTNNSKTKKPPEPVQCPKECAVDNEKHEENSAEDVDSSNPFLLKPPEAVEHRYDGLPGKVQDFALCYQVKPRHDDLIESVFGR